MNRRKSKKTEEVEVAEKKPSDGGTSKDSDSSTNSSTINSTTNVLKNQQKKKDERRRTNVFATIVYPESAPADWIQIIKDTHVPTLISPLHDKDILPDGSPKKAHYHVMQIYDGNKNFETQVKPVFDRFGGVGREEILSQRGYARYMCHMDNPEKYQYEQEEVQEINGACYSATISLPTDELGMVDDMLCFIEDNDIYSFRKFLFWCKDNQKEWFRVLVSSKTYIIKEYLKSRYWDLTNEDELEHMLQMRYERLNDAEKDVEKDVEKVEERKD